MSLPLPPRPNFEQLKHQAKDLLKAHREGNASACEMLRRLRRFAHASDREILTADVALNEAQYALAMSYGFESWAKLKAHVEAPPRRLGEMLIEAGFLTEQRLLRALEYQKQASTRQKLGRLVVDLGFAHEWHVLQVLGEQLGMPFLHLDKIKPQAEAIERVPRATAAKYRILPLRLAHGTLTAAISDPDEAVRQKLCSLLKLDVKLILSPAWGIAEAIERYYGCEDSTLDTIYRGVSDQEGVLLSLVLAQALSDKATRLRFQHDPEHLNLRHSKEEGPFSICYQVKGSWCEMCQPRMDKGGWRIPDDETFGAVVRRLARAVEPGKSDLEVGDVVRLSPGQQSPDGLPVPELKGKCEVTQSGEFRVEVYWPGELLMLTALETN